MEQESFNELILALPPTVEGDTTSYYLHRQLKRPGLKLTTIAKGVAIGDTLEFADEVTLGRSITNRVLFEK
jgi:recombination protein RecR